MGYSPFPRIPMLFMIYVLSGTAGHSEQANSTKCPAWSSKTCHLPSLYVKEQDGAGTAGGGVTFY